MSYTKFHLVSEVNRLFKHTVKKGNRLHEVKLLAKLGCLIFCAVTLYAQIAGAESRKIKAGALMPLTGEYASYGALVLEGIKLRSEGVIDWHVEDIGTLNAKDALTAANALLSRVKPELVLNFGCDDAEWVAPLFTRKKVPLVTAWDSNRRFEELGDYSFSVGFDTDTAGEKIAEHAVKRSGAKNLAIIAEEVPYTRAAAMAFSKKALSLGAHIEIEDWFTLGTTDFRSSILKVKANKIDAVYFLPALPSAMRSFIKQRGELQNGALLYSNELLAPSPFFPANVESFSGCASWIPLPSSLIISNYRRRFGKEPWNHGPLIVGYEAADTILQALENVSSETTLDMALRNILGPTRRSYKSFEVFCWKGGTFQSSTGLYPH